MAGFILGQSSQLHSFSPSHLLDISEQSLRHGKVGGAAKTVPSKELFDKTPFRGEDCGPRISGSSKI